MRFSDSLLSELNQVDMADFFDPFTKDLIDKVYSAYKEVIDRLLEKYLRQSR